MKYCIKCVLPETRPNLKINRDGICNACETFKKRVTIDWQEKETEFNDLTKSIKSKGHSYDCVIPVSGGKDSTWQVVKALEYGLRPLCVTWKTPARNSIGDYNLQNLINIGVDHIDFSINPKVEKTFTRLAFEKIGIPLLPMHMAIHALPLKVALSYDIPLIIWGENPAIEYGATKRLQKSKINSNWRRHFGVSGGTLAEDWVGEELSLAELTPYRVPAYNEKSSKIKSIFLGNYFKWDPKVVFSLAAEHGLKKLEKPKTGLYDFADIDDKFLVTVHHWLKWHKFGFTRTWDNLSLEIRNKRITRLEAIKTIKKFGEEKCDTEIEEFCNYINISKADFFVICDSLRAEHIWKKNKDGKFQIDEFLIKDWVWT